MIREIRQALVIFALLTVVTGVLYPGLVTLVARFAFPDQADGSAVIQDGRIVGSELLGQPFSDPRYFWGRPSATGPQPYNGGASSGSNLAATNPALIEAVAGRVKALRDADPNNRMPRTRRSGDGIRQRPRPAHLAGRGRLPGRARGAPARHVRRTKSARWWRNSPKAGPSEYWASPGSMCCVSISRSMLDDERLTIS